MCELKEDFRFARLMVRPENISDNPSEQRKLALAYALARITPWNKPVLLYEKNCARYEESASVLFERLVDSGRKDVRYILDRGGKYHFGDLRVSSMNMDVYDKYAAKRSKEPFKVSEYDDKSVKGTVDLSKDGILFLSIASNTNWDVYVDGEKADKLTGANIAFMGTGLKAGTHDVELKYNNRMQRKGIVLSLAGLLIALGIAFIFRRRNREKGNNVRNI